MICRLCNRDMTDLGRGRFICPTVGCESEYTPDPATFALIDAAAERVGGVYMSECIGLAYQGQRCTDGAEWCPDPDWAMDGLDLPDTIGFADLIAWNAWQLELIDVRADYERVA